MHTLTAYFAGVGTVAIALAAGLGGGLQVANVMYPKPPVVEATKLERRATAEPLPAPSSSPSSSSPSSSSPSPYLAATQDATKPIVIEPAPAKDSTAQPGRDAAASPATTTPTATTPAATAPATSAPAAQPAAAGAPSPSAEPAPREAHEQTGAPETASTKAQAGEPRTRDADTTRTVERRHTQHRQQWAEQRRRPRDRYPDQRDAEQAWREDDSSRSDSPHAYVVEPAETPMPRFRLFDGF